jgi:FLVCR family feline leukemia virus subgroup C receptor-related protein
LLAQVSYPSDETSIEAVQQLCANLFSALLVPLCEKAATLDYEVLPGLLGRPEDMRGDSVVLVALTLATTLYFTTFNAPLKRSEFDAHN